MSHIEAMKQWLEALEGFIDITKDSQGVKGYRLDGRTSEWDEFHEVDQAYDAITSLRQAIAEAEKQEPHSWYSVQHDEWMTEKTRKEHERLNSYTHKVGGFDLALYTHPQPKREWVGLTDEEYLSKAYRLANELKCHLAIAPATQPAQTPWVGLTDAEVFELFRHEGTADSDINPLKLLADARRIEAKLKEKNT